MIIRDNNTMVNVDNFVVIKGISYEPAPEGWFFKIDNGIPFYINKATFERKEARKIKKD